MRELKGVVAVVTGAASGIGRALAVDLAKLGTQLALADVNAAGLKETRSLLGDAAARTYTVDVSKASAVENFARNVERDFGRAQLLVNNAGVALMGAFTEVSLEDMEWLIGINFWGVVHGCKFFLPLLLRESESHIVNLSSIFGLIGPPGQTAYAASKFAVRGFSESLREELREKGVRVSSVHPAGIATPIAHSARAGRGVTSAARREAEEYFKKVAIITPQEASRVIIKGIRDNKNRVLIGADAYRIDLIQRLFPSRASAMFASFLEKRRGTKSPESAASASKTV